MTPTANGATLDAGALIAIERRSMTVRNLLETLAKADRFLYLPAPVLAQVFRGGPQQHALNRFLDRTPMLRVVNLDHHAALAVGRLLAESGTADVVDAAVVVCARQFGGTPIVTSDPADITKLAPDLPVHRI